MYMETSAQDILPPWQGVAESSTPWPVLSSTGHTI
jgi:hypothetical protein